MTYSRLKSIRRTVAAGVLIVAIAAPAFAASGLQSSYVELGENGTIVARAITMDTTCPTLTADGRSRPMALRASAGTLPLRQTQSTPENSKPSAFPVLTCELSIPVGTKNATVEGHALPLPPPRIDRIVVIGDTGCRVKASDKAFQACNDPQRYPFATIAMRAAAWKPDLVVHVGDYLYRENPCPAGNAGCAGTPWGYGWDAWQADFFAPAAPLLQTAPWILVRGNHENCDRAGQGWWRMLDPRPLVANRNCNDPANDFANDYSEPFAVPIGGGAQVIALDLAIAADTKPLTPDDPRAVQFRDAYAKLDALSRKASFTFAATHKPILGFAAQQKDGPVTLRPGNTAIQSVFGALNPDILPAKVNVLLAGHVHLWQEVSFSSPHPTQFVAGFSGTEEDVVPLPEKLPPGATPAPGAVPDSFSSWIDGFGYMTLERRGPASWDVKVWNLAGEVVNHCEIAGRRSKCDKPQVH